MSFEKVVIQKKQDDNSYIEDYPKTSQDMVLNLLNSSTKALMGLEESATADDAFKQLYLANVLNGKSMVELTFLDSETNKPLSGVVVSCDKFCDAAGTALTEHTTDVNGKIVAFVSAINPIIKIDKYVDIELSQTLAVDALGKQYIFTLKPTIYNYKLLKSSQNICFSENVKQIDYTIVGGGGGGGLAKQFIDNDDKHRTYRNYGGNGRYAKTVNQVSVSANSVYPLVIGSGGVPRFGGYGSYSPVTPGNGGTSTFLETSVNGGDSGDRDTAYSGNGNGYGGGIDCSEGYDPYQINRAPTRGSVLGYIDYNNQDYFGGGGCAQLSNGTTPSVEYGSNAPCSDSHKYYSEYPSTGGGQDGYGGGGGGPTSSVGGHGGRGGSGRCAIRMHLKSRS